MKLNAKLLIIAFILAIFSVGAVAACENITDFSDLTQVPHEQVVSVPDSTVQEVETIITETSVDDTSDNIKSSNVTDSSHESLKETKSETPLLGATNDEDVLGKTVYVNGDYFANLRTAISEAGSGDVIDLQGKTIIGPNAQFGTDKDITIANGVFQPTSAQSQGISFKNCKLENLTFKYFYYTSTIWPVGFNNVTLTNVTFQNFSLAGAFGTAEKTKFYNCKFINMTSRMAYDPENFEIGAMLIIYNTEVDNSEFINCTTNRHSGAICVAGRYGNIANITNSRFINCSAGIGGAIYVHGTMNTTEDYHSNIINCTFYDCSATDYGGAIGSSHDYLLIEGCEFVNNTAKSGGAIMVGGITHGLDGDNSQGHYNWLKNCTFINNTATEEGGAVHITGHDNEALNCTFYYNDAHEGGAVHITGDNSSAIDSYFHDNFAHGGNGSAIYVHGLNASVQNSTFVNHDSSRGTVYIHGSNSTVKDSFFENNTASRGGAGVYILGDNSYLDNNAFVGNNATIHGGAIHTHGNNVTISNSQFVGNNAIPNVTNKTQGLGGAVYIQGNNNLIYNSNFTGNTARNGSAIYNNGENLTLIEDNFHNNQAWSYIIITVTDPPSPMYYNESQKVKINLTMVGGDNIINAIHNAADVDDIFFYNVTYYHSTTETTKTTTEDEIHPRDGVENSEGGRYLYQDDREDLQFIQGNVTYEVNGDVIPFAGRTGLYGNLTVTLYPILHAGNYTVFAEHPDDENYTAISNTTQFEILPYVDVSVTKTSNKEFYIVGEDAIFTITVSNVGSNATNVTVRDILPDSLTFVSASATQGTYNSSTNVWHVGNMINGMSRILTLTVKTTEIGSFNNVVNVTSNEKDWNLSNNVANKTIEVNIYYDKEVNVSDTSAGEYIEYYLNIYNVGDSLYNDTIQVRDALPEGIRYTGEYSIEGAELVRYVNFVDVQVWYITNIPAQSTARITIKAEALTDGVWNNTMNVWDYPEKNATVNVSSNADLQVIKSASVSQVNVGDVFNWTIVVINHGPSKAFNVYVDDLMPSGLEIIGNPIYSTGTRYISNTGKWNIGTLDVDGQVSLIIPVRVTQSGVNITNVAVVNSTTPDPDLTNNEDNATVYFNPDVGIVKSVSSQSTSHGEIITWTLTVTNYGPNNATGVYVIDKLPLDSLKYINQTRTKGEQYNPVSGRWVIGNLKEGESAVLTISTQVLTYDGYISNNATVYATNDNNPDNNYAENFTQVDTEADVSIVKLVSNQTSHYEDVITWTLIVTNNGPSTAENVYVIDFLPTNLQQTAQPYITKGQIAHLGTNGLWTIGSLENGENATMIIYTKIMDSNTTIINTANVTTSTYDPDLSNNWAENGTYVPLECDVEVIKEVSNSTPKKYDEVTWTITVINHGRDVAEDVVVTDVLPDGLEFVSNTVPTIGSYNKDRNEWTIGNLEVNVRQTLTITTQVVDTGEITNEVNVTTSTYDTDETNNYDNETIDVPAIADLEVIKEVSNKTPKYGDLINWTITVNNIGPDSARHVVVNDLLPAGLIYITHNVTSGLYDPSQGIWQIGNVLHFENETLTITTRVNITNATITNIAVVTSTTPDPNPDNNEANNTTTVGPVADLAIEKTVNDHGPAKGDNITWTITVVNKGPDAAINAYVEDVIPGGLIFVNATSEHGEYDNNTNIWTIGDMANGETRILYIVTYVNVTKEVITNTANVTSETEDFDLTNNEDDATIDVGHLADLEVIKTVNNSTPTKGDTIIWNITVINHGPDAAIEAFVADVLPDGLIYQSDDSEGDYNPVSGIWFIGDLQNGANATLLIKTLVNVSGKNITNIAVVDSDTDDPDETNNEDNDTVTVKNLADLAVEKYSTPLSEAVNGEIVYWTIYVTNYGPDTAVDAYVEDILPDELIYVTSSATKGNYSNETHIWTIGNMTKGEFQRLTITTILNCTYENTIRNNVTVNSSTEDPNLENNENYWLIDVIVLADLEIIKEVSNKTPHAGDLINWTVTVTNNGPSDACDVVVTDVLPNGLVYQTDDSEGKYNPSTGIWEIENLADGETRVLVITTLVNITNKTITNVANVTSTTPDPNEENNKANNTTKIDPEADLEIIKLVSASIAKKGDVITWTIVVTNNGPDTALNVYVRDELPDELVLIKYSKTKGLFDSETFTWFISKLDKGESQTLTLTTLVNVTNKTLVNNVNVTNDVYDPNETNNKANNTTDVESLADLVVVKEVSNKNPKFGETIFWTVTVTNNGPDVAVNTKVTDKLPAGLIFVGSDGNYDAATGVWNVGDLANGESKSLKITTIVNITNATILNVANVTSDTPGNNTPGNNTTDVFSIADLEVIKLVSNSTAKKGDIITWTIVVTNNGPDSAVNVKVTDKLPDGLIYNGHNAEIGNYDPVSGVWIVGDLASGVSKTLNISTIVNITNKTIVNVANVTSDTPGNRTNGTNNTTSVPLADLEVIKTAMNATVKIGDLVFWNIIVINHGPDTVTSFTITDLLEDGLIFVDTHGNLIYDISFSEIFNETLKVGESVEIYVATYVNASNIYLTNHVLVIGDIEDPNPDNNEDEDVVEVIPTADVEVAKFVSSNVTKTGEVITWTIVVTNNGPDTAVNVKVTDNLPDGLISNGHNAEVGNYDPQTGVWIVGDLASGVSKTLNISTIVNITNKTIVNVANVTSDTPDSNKTNNIANNTTDVCPEADLVITKTVSNSTPSKGDIIIWTITVVNNGPDAAVNVTIFDEVPEGLTVIENGRLLNSRTITVFIPELESGKTTVFDFETLVDVTNINVTNVASVNSTTYDPNKTNNKDNETVKVNPEADLEITKLVSNTTARYGDEITWTVIVTNNGPDAAVNVVVNEKLPVELIYNTHTAEEGLYDVSKGIWKIDTLASGESVKLEIITTVNATNKNITNIVDVTSDTPDSNKTNNAANNTTDVPPEADIGVVKEVNATECMKDQFVEWTITMTNHGPDGASNVVVKDNLPETLIFVSSDGNYNPDTGIWTIDYLANGETRVLHIITKVNTTGIVIVNNVTATSGVYDPDMSNNNASNSTKVLYIPSADLEVVKVVSNSTPHKGDLITWTITVTNNGPDTAQDVSVSDKLPNGLVFMSCDGDYDYTTGIWTVGDLTNGESKTLQIITMVDTTNANVTNVAVVNSTTSDPNTDNNIDNDTIEIAAEADIKVVKTVSNPKPSVGDVITWTIVVVNLGPDSAENVIVEEIFPEGLRLISAKGSKGKFLNEIWTVGTLANGEIATLTLTTKVTGDEVIENVVIASSSTYDPNKTNNMDVEITTPKVVETSADLEIIKTSNVKVVKKGDIIVWTIVVINHGPDKAKNVVVSDSIEKGIVEFIDAKVSKGKFSLEDGDWYIGDMEAGERVVLTLTTRALTTGEIINYAYVVSDTEDPNPDNDEDYASVIVKDTPIDGHHHSGEKVPEKMHATGNPIVMVLLALIAIAGAALKRKN